MPDTPTTNDVARIAAAQMGVEPPAPAAAPNDPQAAAAATAAAEVAATKAGQPVAPPEPKDSAQDKATAKGAPKTEADAAAADAVIYKIPMQDGSEREMTPQQIASTMQRYGDLNFQHAQYKPILAAVAKIAQANPGMSREQLMEKISSLNEAGQKNPTLGDGPKSGADRGQPTSQGGQPNTPSNEDLSTMLSTWEEENAATLPPGYKDMISQGPQQLAEMRNQMAQMQQMMQQVLGAAAGQTDAAKASVQQAQGQKISAVKQQIGNNLDRVQAALKIPDTRANDFMTFAAERGYTLEDFIDPQLTVKVMSDFKNEMDSPEMSRMREIAQRRQAFTGSMGSSPSAPGGPAAQPSEAGSTFDELASTVMGRKGLG